MGFRALRTQKLANLIEISMVMKLISGLFPHEKITKQRNDFFLEIFRKMTLNFHALCLRRFNVNVIA
jgi:hypothetical protein